MAHNKNQPVIIKKYANRRLYNTETSVYITLEDLSALVKTGREVEVVDAKTGDDLTRSTLAQIIFDEETRGAAMLPVKFLRQIIQFYDHSLQQVVPHYLEAMMDAFQQNRHQLQEQTDRTLGTFSPFNALRNMSELQRRNMEMAQSTMRMMNPFLFRNVGEGDDKDTQIAKLSQHIHDLNKHIEQLKKR